MGERYLCYLAEQVFLITISSILVYAFGIRPVLLSFFLLYKVNFSAAFVQVFETNAGFQNLLIWFVISLVYYSLEVLTNLGIFRTIFKGRIISKYDIPNNKLDKLLLLRSLVKSFFISNLINSLFIFRYRKNMQTLYDYKTNLVVATPSESTSRQIFTKYLFLSLFIYYSTFFIFLGIFTYVVTGPNVSVIGKSTSSNISVYNSFIIIIHNNLTLDVFDYAIGGLSFFAGTFISLFSSNILETGLIATLNSSNGTSFVKYILPQFFPETLGYVFAIATAMAISDIFISFIQSYIRNQKSDYFMTRSKRLAYISGIYFSISVILLIPKLPPI